MRIPWVVSALGFLVILLAACSGKTASPVIPAADKLTFLFYYTAG